MGRASGIGLWGVVSLDSHHKIYQPLNESFLWLYVDFGNCFFKRAKNLDEFSGVIGQVNSIENEGRISKIKIGTRKFFSCSLRVLDVRESAIR